MDRLERLAARTDVAAYVAQLCGVSRQQVRIVHGQGSRTKQLLIDGLDDEQARQAILAAAPQG
jgi:uncharacterized protein YggU (UPF0235/DUF167 family)